MPAVNGTDTKQTYVWPVSVDDPAFGTARERCAHSTDFLRHLRSWNKTDWVKALREKIGPEGVITLVGGFEKESFTFWSLVLNSKGFRFRTENYSNTMEGRKLHSMKDTRIGRDRNKLNALLLTEPSLSDLALALESAAKDRFIDTTPLYLKSDKNESTPPLTMLDTHVHFKSDPVLSAVSFESHSPTNRFLTSEEATFELVSETNTRGGRSTYVFTFKDSSDAAAAWNPVSHSIQIDQCRVGEIDRTLVRALVEGVEGLTQPEWKELESSGAGVFRPHGVQCIEKRDFLGALPLNDIIETAKKSRDGSHESLFTFPQIEFFVSKGEITIKTRSLQDVFLPEVPTIEELRAKIEEEAFPEFIRNFYRTRRYEIETDNALRREVEDAVEARMSTRFVLQDSCAQGIREVNLQFCGERGALITVPVQDWLYLAVNNLPFPQDLSLEGVQSTMGDKEAQIKWVLKSLQEVRETGWCVETSTPQSVEDRSSLDVTLLFRPIQEGKPYRISDFSAREFDNSKKIGIISYLDNQRAEFNHDPGKEVELHEGISNLVRQVLSTYSSSSVKRNSTALKEQLFRTAEEIMDTLVSTTSQMFEGGQQSIPLGTMRDFLMLGSGATITLRPVWSESKSRFDIYFVDYQFGHHPTRKPMTELEKAGDTFSRFVWPEPTFEKS